MKNKANLSYLMADKAVMDQIRSQHSSLESAAEGASNETLDRLISGDESAISEGAYNQLEAIILLTGRPPLLIQDGKWQEPEIDELKTRLDKSKTELTALIPKVGRVEVAALGDYQGTGWMLDENILITNRHVAELFAERRGNVFSFKKDADGDLYGGQVDFLREHQRTATAQARISEILFLEERDGVRPDMALVRLDPAGGKLPEPVDLDDANPEFDTDIAVVGYPAKDPRNDAMVMRDIFSNIYTVKRLSPGKVRGLDFDGKRLLHDCTTLGGNSGSVVFNLRTNKVCGLHFAGDYRVNNYAVSVGWLKSRLAEIGHHKFISIPAPAGGGAPALPGDDQEERRRSRPSGPDLRGRDGYNPDFLAGEMPVAVPRLSTEDRGRIAEVRESETGELKYTHFSVLMREDRRLPFFTACNIDGEKLFNLPRATDRWYHDERLVDRDSQIGEELYSNNPFDRGHLVRRLDPVWGDTREEAKQAELDTFHFTNCSPQHSNLNQRTWLSLEDYVLNNAATHQLKVNVFTGPVMKSSDQEYRGVQIPKEFWKVVSIVNTFTGKLSVTAYLLSQADLIRDIQEGIAEEFVFGAFRTYQLPVTQIEQRTGLSFGDLKRYDPLNLAEGPPQRVISAGTDLVL